LLHRWRLMHWLKRLSYCCHWRSCGQWIRRDALATLGGNCGGNRCWRRCR
jgi:hypothetical protein